MSDSKKIIIYAGGKGSGKTMRLVDLALKTGGYIIVPKYNDSLNPAYKELDDLGASSSLRYGVCRVEMYS